MTTALTSQPASSSAAIRSRLRWSMTAMSAGVEALDQVLGAPPEAGGPSIGRALAPRPLRVGRNERARSCGGWWSPSPPIIPVRRTAQARRLRAAPVRACSPSCRRGRRRASGRSRRPARRRRPSAPSAVACSPPTSFSIRKWVSGQRGDLRQVGDAEHLALVAQRPQPLADRAGGVAADPGVDLVEDEGRGPAPRALARERQHHPRELAARGRVAQRRDRHPGVGRDPELDRLLARARRSRPGAARARPRASRRSSRAARARSATRFSSSPAADVRASLSSAASSRAPLRRLGQLAPRAPRRARRRPRSARSRSRQRLGVGQDGLDRAAVLALQPVEHVEALLDLGQPPGRALDAVGVGAKLAGQLPHLDRQGLRARAELVERRVDALLGGQRRLGDGDRLGGAALVAAARRRARAPRGGAAERLGVAQPLALGRQLGLLGGIGLRRPRSPRARSAAGRCRARARPGARGARPARARSRHLGVGRRGRRGAARGAARPAKPSSVSSWARGQGQLAVLVLAVEGEQVGAERLQLRRGGRAPLEEGAGPARAPTRGARRRSRSRPRAAARRSRPARARRAARRAARTLPRRRPRSRPGRTICGRALPPMIRSSEWASTVLPAPVSPVIAFSPRPSRSSARSIRSRFSIRSSRSIAHPF